MPASMTKTTEPSNLIRLKLLGVRILRSFGVDRAIAYTLVGRGWSVIAGPLTLLLIAWSLRPEEQGFYYSFSSVIALNMFFDCAWKLELLTSS